MESSESTDQSGSHSNSIDTTSLSSPISSPRTSQETALSVPAGAFTCPTCATTAATNGTPPIGYVYAIGTVEPRSPLPSIEKELAQVIGRTDTTGLTDRQALQKVLSQRENRYLARHLCWVLTIEGLETYILVPRDPLDFELLVSAVRAEPSPTDLDVVVGVRGPIASADRCNGLTVPIVFFDQVYSFDRESLIKGIPRPEKIPEEEFAASAEELFDKIQQVADNAGASDDHRALNYLAVRYPAIYASVAEAHGRNCSLSAVGVLTSRLSATRKILDVVFTYTNRTTDVSDKYFVRVDVTEEFPFLVTKLSHFYDR
jgi:PatG C-terminal